MKGRAARLILLLAFRVGLGVADPLRVACIHYGLNTTTCPALPWHMRHLQSALSLEVIIVAPEDSPDVIFLGVLHRRGGIVHARVAEYSSLLNSTAALRIYTTGENTDHLSYPPGELDVSFGVRCPANDPRPCVRIPFWFAYSVTASTCTLHIEDATTERDWAARPNFASLVSSHGGYPREELYDALSSVGQVIAPGRFIHNEPPLDKGGDAKKKFVRSTRFNICPENRPGDGYITEKLIEAFQAGSVPVYWRGDGLEVEPEVFNQARIINLGLLGNLSAVADAVSTLEHDAAARANFFSVPVLKPDAQAVVSSTCRAMVDAFVRGMRARGLGRRLDGAVLRHI
jgi:Glycosyltransferase family 10 (fucosyltransferase) C-term